MANGLVKPAPAAFAFRKFDSSKIPANRIRVDRPVQMPSAIEVVSQTERISPSQIVFIRQVCLLRIRIDKASSPADIRRAGSRGAGRTMDSDNSESGRSNWMEVKRHRSSGLRSGKRIVAGSGCNSAIRAQPGSSSASKVKPPNPKPTESVPEKWATHSNFPDLPARCCKVPCHQTRAVRCSNRPKHRPGSKVRARDGHRTFRRKRAIPSCRLPSDPTQRRFAAGNCSCRS